MWPSVFNCCEKGKITTSEKYVVQCHSSGFIGFRSWSLEFWPSKLQIWEPKMDEFSTDTYLFSLIFFKVGLNYCKTKIVDTTADLVRYCFIPGIGWTQACKGWRSYLKRPLLSRRNIGLVFKQKKKRKENRIDLEGSYGGDIAVCNETNLFLAYQTLSDSNNCLVADLWLNIQFRSYHCCVIGESYTANI